MRARPSERIARASLRKIARCPPSPPAHTPAEENAPSGSATAPPLPPPSRPGNPPGVAVSRRGPPHPPLSSRSPLSIPPRLARERGGASVSLRRAARVSNKQYAGRRALAAHAVRALEYLYVARARVRRHARGRRAHVADDARAARERRAARAAGRRAERVDVRATAERRPPLRVRAPRDPGRPMVDECTPLRRWLPSACGLADRRCRSACRLQNGP